MALGEVVFPMTSPRITIVIAAWQDPAGLAGTLESLAAQRESDPEVIVVSPAGSHDELAARFPWVRWAQTSPDDLIPHQWSRGMAQAGGDVIALTTAHFAPAPDWVSSLRRAHARLTAPAIGGRIEPPRGGRAVDWATYFLRYSAYLNSDRERTVNDLAGDNASYKRTALETNRDLLRDGFWERELHLRLRAEGEDLVFIPEIRVTQHGSFGFHRFLRQRFQHGKQFGRSRLRGRSPAIRVAATLAAPLIPAVFLGKILGRVARSGRDLGPFLLALPVLLCFLLAWSLGEACGYLAPASPGRSRRFHHGSVIV